MGRKKTPTLGDFIEDRNAPAPADAASFQLLKEQVDEVLHTLTEREVPGVATAVWFGGQP